MKIKQNKIMNSKRVRLIALSVLPSDPPLQVLPPSQPCDHASCAHENNEDTNVHKNK